MKYLFAIALGLVACTATGPRLDSWNDGAADDITAFVARVTDTSSSDYVPPAERIAVFDNDGTLWAEQPAYFQLLYAIDYVKSHAHEHPEWRTTQPFKAALEGDMEALGASGSEGLFKLVMTSHSGVSSDEFAEITKAWCATAQHPTKGRPFTEMIYQPMVEILEYLRANGFKTFIVSGGGVQFIRAFAEESYGIPPEQVIGSTIKTTLEASSSGTWIRRSNEIDFVNDKAGKVIAINRIIGRRPIAAFGNSDGDLQMLQWTAAGDGARLCVLVHHTDDGREWSYDRESHIGRLDKALDEAKRKGWSVIDMKRAWSQVFPTHEP